LPRILTWF